MSKQNSFIFLGVLLCLNILAWITVYEFSKPKFLEVTFFDVGQGDSIFIETPQGHQILIDGGPTAAILEKLGGEMLFFDRDLDLVVLTHPQKDHLTGLIFVLGDYEVNNVLWTGVESDTAGSKEWIEELNKEKAQVFFAKKGLRIKSGEAMLEILFPFEELANAGVKEINDTSVVSHLSFGQNSFLFTGDISCFVEKELLQEGANVDADVLKVAHHGSKYSSCEEFLEAVSPQLAVIQVGKNSYGHPTEEVLQRLEKFAINVLRTDIEGDIKVVSDGNNLEIYGSKEGKDIGSY